MEAQEQMAAMAARNQAEAAILAGENKWMSHGQSSAASVMLEAERELAEGFAAGIARTTLPPCSVQGCEGVGRYRVNELAACSSECLEQLLRGVVLEEQAFATAAALKAGPRVQIGRILIEQGTITEPQLERALRSQQAAGAGRLGCWLKQQVHLPEADFTAALSIQWRCPVFRLGTFNAGRMISYLPRPLVEEHGALPLRLTGTPARLSIAFEDHIDYELIHAAERMHGISVDAGLLTAPDFWQVTRNLLELRPPAIPILQAPSHDCMAQALSRALTQAPIAEARLVVVYGCFWLRAWLRPGSQAAPHAGFVDLLCSPSGAGVGALDGEDATGALTRAMLGTIAKQREGGQSRLE